MRGALITNLYRTVRRAIWAVAATLAVASATSPASGIPAAKSLALCRLDTWGIRDGLPGYDITALAQTPDGYLWIGTTGGLLRFDGVSFTLFDRHNLPGLTDATIRGLGVDNKGRLLIGAEWCGYGRMINGAYVRSPFPDKNWNSVHMFHYAPDGSLWIGYQGFGYLVREADGVARKITIPAGLFMSGIADMPGGKELICSNYGGLYLVSPDGAVTTVDTAHQVDVNDFTAMARTPDGTIWIGTDSHGIYKLDGKVCTHLTIANGLASNTIHCMYVDSKHRLWIGTNSGIDTPSGTSFIHFGAKDGLASDDVSAILEDHEGNMWVASGIYLNRFADTRFTPVGFGPGMMSQIQQVTLAGNGDVLCGTLQGLWRLSPVDGALPKQVTKFRIDGATTLRNGDLFVWAIRDPFSSMVGVLRAGKLIAQQIVRYNVLAVQPTTDGVDVYSQFQDFQHFSWNPAANGGRGALTASASHQLLPSASGMEIFDAKPAGDGSMWLGTTRGLVVSKDGNARILDIPLPPNAHVLSIDASTPGRLWFGTDHGLALLEDPNLVHPWNADPTVAKLTLFTKNDGLPSNEILQVLNDNEGTIWIGGYFGICSIQTGDLNAREPGTRRSIGVKLYTSADGIRSYPSLASPLKTANGRLWFVGSRGLTQIDPDRLISNTYPPPVQIEDATANNVVLKPGMTTDVHPGRGSLIVHYAGLSYVEPELVDFRYRLVGFDQGWVDAGTRRVATYTNLPPGTYTFRVIACNNQRVWNTTGASITFVLKPHFYQTVWFRVVLGVLALLAIAGVVILRTRAVMSKARELERKVAERTTELIQANGQLKDLEEELRLQNLQLKETQEEVEAQNEELHGMQTELMAQNDELQSVQAELEAQNQELLETQDQLTQANARLEALATTDGLTGLYNHRMFHEQMEQEWTRHARYGTAMSVILMDVDKFKQYNDSFGHPAGDDVLRKVAEVLKSTARSSDLVARYGGEEFVVIARESDARSAGRLAERIRAALEAVDWPLRPVTGSFGVASADAMTSDVNVLIEQADAALYRSKNGGRNRVTHYRDAVPVAEKA